MMMGPYRGEFTRAETVPKFVCRFFGDLTDNGLYSEWRTLMGTDPDQWAIFAYVYSKALPALVDTERRYLTTGERGEYVTDAGNRI